MKARLLSVRREGLMFGWHNVKMHSLTYKERSRLYWPRPDRWLEEYLGGRRHAVPTTIL